jgi:ribosomal protein L29
MAVLKNKDVKKMDEKERKKKTNELRFELIKRKSGTNKQSKIKTKEIKKAIARLLTVKEKKQ